MFWQRQKKTESVFELEENLNQKTETNWDEFQIFSEALSDTIGPRQIVCDPV